MSSHHTCQAGSSAARDHRQVMWKRGGLVLINLLITWQLIGCGGGSGYSSLASSSSSVSSSSSASSIGVTLSNAFPALAAFTNPVLAVQAPGNNTRWFVVQQNGHVRMFNNTANVTSHSDFLDVSTQVTFGGELGLLGFAFHPNFPTDPRVFVDYTATINGQLVSHVSSFTTTDGGATINASTETVLLTVNQPETNHKGGNLVFGPDGFLYIGFGDGGGGGDQHGTIGNGQNLNTLLGKILRIDVGIATATTYSIPADNPYVSNPHCGVDGTGTQACPEIFAYGFRNPWRFSFDSQTGELWVGDVGQDAWEEVDLVVKGGNYGWRCREGAHNYNTSGCTGTYIDPIWNYDHTQGIAVTGGYVYRGSLNVAMQGKYIFGDYGSGRIWMLTPPIGMQAAQVTQLSDSGYSISSFAQGNDGELYLLDYANGYLIRLAF